MTDDRIASIMDMSVTGHVENNGDPLISSDLQDSPLADRERCPTCQGPLSGGSGPSCENVRVVQIIQREILLQVILAVCRGAHVRFHAESRGPESHQEPRDRSVLVSTGTEQLSDGAALDNRTDS